MKDLRDFFSSKKDEAPDDDEDDAPTPAEKPDLGSKRLVWLAQETGVENPEALVALVKAACKQYAGESTSDDEG